jgi:SAM-dependent methyltransferase
MDDIKRNLVEGPEVWETTAFENYYSSSQGQVVRRLICRRLMTVITDMHQATSDQSLAAGIGYARPFLRFLDKRHGDVIGLQSVGIKPRSWPRQRPSRLASVEEGALPLLSSTLETILLVHGLETTPDPSTLVQECWRVLKGMGRLVVVVPHRGSMWAGRESTPFGYGQPYSINQIKSLLKSHDFDVTKVQQALVAPPSGTPFYSKIAPLVERLPNPLGGVLIVDARKMIYSVRGVPVASRKLVRPSLVGINSSIVPRFSGNGDGRV